MTIWQSIRRGRLNERSERKVNAFADDYSLTGSQYWQHLHQAKEVVCNRARYLLAVPAIGQTHRYECAALRQDRW
ncbi:MAG TPA: hypothetical protein VGR71_10880, partial [Nitrospira sp.]|nr:hypothetical protein [Nitrospira sp.]